ncbi:D-2-hydroxyacid dehydrogenase [soil metagenome]
MDTVSTNPATNPAGPILVIEGDSEYIAEQLRLKVPGVRIEFALSAADAPADVSAFAGLMVIGSALKDDLLRRMTGLRWLQLMTSGTDSLNALTAVPEGIHITTVRGVHPPAVSEMAIFLMMSLARRVTELLANQRAHVWSRGSQPLLNHKTVTIVGTGVIAQELARRCRVLGMTTVGVTTTVRAIDGFDEVVPRDGLRDAAARCDFMVLLVPLDKDTRGLIDKAIFGVMKPSAYLVNLARGPVCVEADLIAALQDGTIAGAGLDVFDVEPLPTDHALWDLPNVIITPHIGGASDRYADQVLPVVEQNLRLFSQGRESEMVNLQTRP